MASETKERVGIVGVGRMGLAMLKHLVKHGYPVTACDLDDKQRAKAREAGATTVKTPAEVARAADFVIIGVGYDDEVNAVVLGADGLLADLAPGSIIAVSSTAKPDTVKALEQRAQAQGVGVLDAPICRGRFAADEGTLLALVGGKPDVVERGRAVYGCFCSDYAHLGDVGHGQVGKTMNNLLLWINAVGLIEAGRLAESTGIDLAKLRAALLMSSGASDALKEWDMISFTWALKDMQIVADLTDKAGLSLPITGAIKELVKDARRIKATNAPKWTGTCSGRVARVHNRSRGCGLRRSIHTNRIPSRQIHRRDAAVDEQVGAIDERGILAHQEQHRLGGLLRLARALRHVRHRPRRDRTRPCRPASRSCSARSRSP